jgi:hypothetical protein
MENFTVLPAEEAVEEKTFQRRICPHFLMDMKFSVLLFSLPERTSSSVMSGGMCNRN